MTAILVAALLCADPGVNSAVVRIDNKDTQSTGVVYHRYGDRNSQYLILTCAHGKKQRDWQTVTFGGRSADYGRILAIDYKRDLAVVYVESKNHPQTVHVRIQTQQLEPGEVVRIKGYGHGHYTERNTTVVGPMMITTANGNYRERLKVKGAIQPGDSGGLLIDEAGKLVGISNAYSKERDVDGFFVTLDDINEFLKEEGLEP